MRVYVCVCVCVCVCACVKGNWINDKRSGKGMLKYNSGVVFWGTFANNVIVCVTGKLIYPDGSVYTGGVKNKQRCGKGKMQYVNGNMYVIFISIVIIIIIVIITINRPITHREHSSNISYSVCMYISVERYSNDIFVYVRLCVCVCVCTLVFYNQI